MLTGTILPFIMVISAALTGLYVAAASSPTSTAVDAYPQLCDAHKDVGLDFKVITAPCTCLQITSVDTVTIGLSANKTALVRVDVLCEDMQLDKVRTAFSNAAKVPFTPTIAGRLNEPNATKLLVYYNVVLRHVGAVSYHWEGSWSFFVNDINMHDFSTSKNSTAAVESITFDACKDLYTDLTLTSQQNALIFGNRTFSPLKKVKFLNMPESSYEQPVSTGFRLGQLGIESPLPDIDVEHSGRLPLLELVFRNTLISQISSQAFTKLDHVDALALTIVNAQLPEIPLAALSVFSNISTFNITNNKIHSVAAPANIVPSVASIGGGTLDLSNNLIQELTAEAFWNRMPKHTPSNVTTADRLTTLCLRQNQITTVDAGAFDFLISVNASTNSSVSKNLTNFFIDLSNNKLTAIPGAALLHLPSDTVDFDLSHNLISHVEESDLFLPMWNKLAPIRLANNPYNCTDLDNMAWLACWAQHMVGNLTINIDYLKCAVGNATTMGNSTTDLVKYHFIPNGKCLKYFPNDKMFIWHDGGGGGGRGPGYIHAWEVLMLLFVLAMAVTACVVGFMLYTKRWTLNRFVRFRNEEERGGNAPTYGGIA